MKGIIVSLVNNFSDLTEQWFQTNSPEFKVYKKYISNSNKIKNQNVANGMAAAASIVEVLDQRRGTLALAVALASNGIKLANTAELGDFMAGVDLIMNKSDELLQYEVSSEESVSKALLHTFGHLPEAEMINKCFEVCTIAGEIESALKK